MTSSIPYPASAGRALVMLALLVLLASMAGCAREAPRAPPLPAVFVSTVRNDNGAELRLLSGSVKPRVESELAFRTGGAGGASRAQPATMASSANITGARPAEAG